MAPPTLNELVADRLDDLTPAERKVADTVLSAPELVAFGTVAQLAQRAGASGASVVRLACKLGFDGYGGLQDTVQVELSHRLRPASERIRERADRDIVGRAMRAALDAVHATLDDLDTEAFDEVVALLADTRRAVWFVSGDAASGLGAQAVSQWSSLRPRVELIEGNPVAVARTLASVAVDDLVIALDLRRYDEWVVGVAERVTAAGAVLVALTDSPVSPLARSARRTFVVEAEGAGPFDTYVGAMALLDALVAGAARALRTTASKSLDRIEAEWQESRALLE